MKICLHYIICVTQTYTLMTKLCSWLHSLELLLRAQFWSCCLSISIDLSFDRQHHNITQILVFIVRFRARHLFINAWDRSFLSDFFSKLRSETERAFPIVGNLFEPLPEDFISVFDRSIFCMTLPHSLWFGRFFTILKAMGSDWMEQVYSICWPDRDCYLLATQVQISNKHRHHWKVPRAAWTSVFSSFPLISQLSSSLHNRFLCKYVKH